MAVIHIAEVVISSPLTVATVHLGIGTVVALSRRSCIRSFCTKLIAFLPTCHDIDDILDTVAIAHPGVVCEFYTTDGSNIKRLKVALRSPDAIDADLQPTVGSHYVYVFSSDVHPQPVQRQHSQQSVDIGRMTHLSRRWIDCLSVGLHNDFG